LFDPLPDYPGGMGVSGGKEGDRIKLPVGVAYFMPFPVDRAQHGIDKPGRPGRQELCQLDRFVHRRRDRYPVEKYRLIEPKAEQDEDYSLQLFDFLPGKLVDYMVESPLMP
jgi:hypothetical protein